MYFLFKSLTDRSEVTTLPLGNLAHTDPPGTLQFSSTHPHVSIGVMGEHYSPMFFSDVDLVNIIIRRSINEPPLRL